jgi:hypothetical protein
VLAGAKEEGADDDARRPALDAPGVRRRDRRLGQLHVGRLHDVVPVAEAFAEQLRHALEHPVALVPSGAVVDDDDAVAHTFVARASCPCLNPESFGHRQDAHAT